MAQQRGFKRAIKVAARKSKKLIIARKAADRRVVRAHEVASKTEVKA
jgi:hypothetical protein